MRKRPWWRVDGGDEVRNHPSLPFAFRVSGLKDAGGRHEVLDVLTQNLVLRLELEVFLFHGIHSCREI